MNHTTTQSEMQITVVIPAYNVEGYIQRAIDSILDQTRLPNEIIVVDDGSSDATAEKIKPYGDKVRYIYQDNRGLSGARNTGIREAAYDWIAFLDADDEWLPKHLQLQTALLESNPDLRWMSGNFICCLCDEDRQGAAGEPETIRRLMEGKEYFSSYFKAHANGVAGHPDTMLIHKEIFDQIGFFNEQQAFAEDIEMWWRIAFSCPCVGYVAEPIAVYHLQRPGTLTEEFQKRKFHWLIRLLEDNLEVAVVKDRLDEFKPVVRFLVTSWIRGLLFENNPDLVKELIGKFGMFLSIRFRLMVNILMVYPEGTAWMCHRVSRIVRKYKLRKKIMRPPSS